MPEIPKKLNNPETEPGHIENAETKERSVLGAENEPTPASSREQSLNDEALPSHPTQPSNTEIISGTETVKERKQPKLDLPELRATLAKAGDTPPADQEALLARMVDAGDTE